MTPPSPRWRSWNGTAPATPRRRLDLRLRLWREFCFQIETGGDLAAGGPELTGERLAPLLPGKAADRGRSCAGHRLCIDAVARGASPWRDLPPEPGHWKAVHTRFRRWSRAGAWERPFKESIADPGFEHVLIDLSRRTPCVRVSLRKISKLHADATSQKGGLKLTPSAGPAPRWADGQDPCRRRCARPAAPAHDHTGPLR